MFGVPSHVVFGALWNPRRRVANLQVRSRTCVCVRVFSLIFLFFMFSCFVPLVIFLIFLVCFASLLLLFLPPSFCCCKTGHERGCGHSRTRDGGRH